MKPRKRPVVWDGSTLAKELDQLVEHALVRRDARVLQYVQSVVRLRSGEERGESEPDRVTRSQLDDHARMKGAHMSADDRQVSHPDRVAVPSRRGAARARIRGEPNGQIALE